MESARSPLQDQLHRIRVWMVVIINAAFLLFTIVTVLVGPSPISLHELLYGSHKVRTWSAMMAVTGLLAVGLWPRRVKVIYLPYLLVMLWITVQEVQGTVIGQVMPYQLALWLSVNMTVIFLVFGVRWGLAAFLTVMSVTLLALSNVSHLITGYLRVDWITTLIVMTVAGTTSLMLMSMIERNLLVNERALLQLRSAQIDAVTGVPGRAVMEERLEELVQQSRAAGTPLGVVLADLDHFKSVNDQYGHQVGDNVLREFAELARRVVPGQGVVGRWGGEEFMALLPGFSYQQTLELAWELCRAVQDHPFGAGVRVTASLGVAALEDRVSSVEGLYQRADQALYRAKGDGRNRVV